MTGDDLSAPLGLGTRAKGRTHPISSSRIAIIVLSGVAAGFGALAMIRNDPFGGAPLAVAPAGSKPALTDAKVAEPVAGDLRNSAIDLPGDRATGHPPAGRTVTIIDGTSGKRRDIVIPGTADFIDVDAPSSESPGRGANTPAFGNSTPPR